MLDRATQWMTGFGGLFTWVAIVVVIVGVGLVTRHLTLSSRAMELRHVVLIVAASVGLLLIAGAGGLALMHAAASG
jgi:hypothetical protein